VLHTGSFFAFAAVFPRMTKAASGDWRHSRASVTEKGGNNTITHIIFAKKLLIFSEYGVII